MLSQTTRPAIIKAKDPQMLRAIDALKGVMIYAQQSAAEGGSGKEIGRAFGVNCRAPRRLPNLAGEAPALQLACDSAGIRNLL
jgi:hypothetical protein